MKLNLNPLYMNRYVITVGLLFALLLSLSAGCSNQAQNIFGITGKTTLTSIDVNNAQEVLIGLKGGRYILTPNQVEVNKPVLLKNDGTLSGCAVAVVQRELGISVNFARQDTYTFTPTKTGKFEITCAMGMYRGTIEVI